MNDTSSIDLKKIITTACIDVFSTMLSMELTVEDDMKITDTNTYQIVGSVEFSGENISGSVELYVTEHFAKLMAASMLGEDPNILSMEEDVHDVLRELSNMVGGDLKSRLCNFGLLCKLSTPKIYNAQASSAPKEYARVESYYFKHMDNVLFVVANMT